MIWTVLILLLAASLIALLFLIGAVAPAMLLESHRATEARVDQAPLAYALLADLAPAARIEAPRLYVIPAAQANGFSVRGRSKRIIAVTEGVFETLDAAQLKGLLALLVACLARPRARLETALAALALVAAPFVLPSLALVRAGIRGERWHDVDTAAAALVGAGAISETLRKLEAEKRTGGTGAVNLTTACLFCVDPTVPSSNGWANRAFVTQPSTAARLERLRRQPAGT